MKDTLIVLAILIFGTLGGIVLQREYPEHVQRFIPNPKSATQLTYPLLQVVPTGVSPNGLILILHEGGGVTWEKPIPVYYNDITGVTYEQ